MKLIRFALADRVQHGSLQGDQIQPLEGELHALTAVPGANAIPLESVKLLTPTAASKVIAIGPGRRRCLHAQTCPARVSGRGSCNCSQELPRSHSAERQFAGH